MKKDKKWLKNEIEDMCPLSVNGEEYLDSDRVFELVMQLDSYEVEEERGIKMDKIRLYELLENMIQILGEERLLNELFSALSSTELEENLTYIADMNDISYLYEE